MSSALAAASLILKPEGYSEGTLESLKPIDRSGDFTFTRGSNLSATRVNSAGLIEKGRENLLLQSNQFDTTWAGNASKRSITDGFSGYDGSNDAWKLEAVSDNDYSVVSQLISNAGVETFSVYAKAGTSNFFRIQITGGTNTSASYFDLSGSGSVGTNFNNIDAKIESVGNGWFRCSLTGNKTTSSNCVIYVVDANGSTNVTTGANVYIQDAQLEAGMAATDYIETAASTVKAGILENTPRLDYSGGATEPSLLLEPQRTNYLPYSEYIQGIQTNLSYDYNDVASPENVDNGATLKLAADSSAVRHRQLFSLSTTDGTDYTFSVFFKKADANWIQLMGAGASSVFTTSMWANFDLENGVVGNKGTELIDSGIEDYGNGWYRCYISAQAEATATGYFEILTTNNTDSGRYPSYQNSTALDYVHIYGAQVEQGSYPTSYIPTYGSSVTRDADDATLTYSNNFNDITVFTEVNSLDVKRDGSAQNVQIGNDFAQGGAFFLRRSSNTTTKRLLAFFLNNDNTSVFSSYELPEYNSKVAFKYNSTSNACKLFVNGSEVRSGIATDITEFNSFRLNGDGGKFNSKQLVVFNTELSDAECITLTTL